MSGSRYRELDPLRFSEFRRKLLRDKGGTYQRRFAEAALQNDHFVGFVREEAGSYGGETPPLHASAMTENEFRDPPSDTESRLYEGWRDFPAGTACRTAFWADITSRHVEADKIHANYLAANGGAQVNGVQRLESALADDGPHGEKRMDDCVRTILRRLGGLPEARGARTVYVDSPFARAWWRERLVREVSHRPGATPDRVRFVLRLSQSYWEELVTLVVSRNSVLGSEEVRASFILSLANLLSRDEESPLRTQKELRTACRALGVVQATRELSVLEDEPLQQIMDDLVLRQHEASVRRQKAARSSESSATPSGAESDSGGET